ncbi:MAG TPA: hypothetical protein VF954_00325 [Acidimicrobiales bacterium]
MPTNDLSSRDRIVEYLRSRGGSISNDEGRGLTQALALAAGYQDLSVLNGMLSRLEREGVIERDVRGRRTYGISLGGAEGAPEREAVAAPRGGRTGGGGRGGRREGRRGGRSATAPSRRPAMSANGGAAGVASGIASGVGVPTAPAAPPDEERWDEMEATVRRLRSEVAQLTARLERVEAGASDVAGLASQVDELNRHADSQRAAAAAGEAPARRGLFGRR